MSIIVAVGEPNPAYGAALVSLIGDEPGLVAAGTVARVGPLMELIICSGAHAAVIASNLPGGGVEAVAEHLQRHRRPCRLILIASVLTPSARNAATRAGVVLVDRADGRRLLEAIRAAEQ